MVSNKRAYVFHSKVKTVLLTLGFEPTLFDSCLYFQFVYVNYMGYATYSKSECFFNLFLHRVSGAQSESKNTSKKC